MASKLFRKALAEVKPETKIFVKKYLDLLERIHELLEEKKMSQKDLAEALEQQPSAVSRLLNSEETYMNLRTVAKLESILGQDILVVKGRESVRRPNFVMLNTRQVSPLYPVHIDKTKVRSSSQSSRYEYGRVIDNEQVIISEAV